jgi:hypothetical protein
MIKKVVFFNNFAFGDLHVSRGLVRATMQLLPDVQFGYVHHRGPDVLADIPRLTLLKQDLPREVDVRETVRAVVDDTLYVNTWYCAGGDQFTRRYDSRCCFDVLYDMFEEMLQEHFSMRLVRQFQPESLFPTIDYGCFDIASASEFLAQETRPIVLVCNGDVTSGQAENFDLGGHVREVAAKMPQYVFVLTSKDWRMPTDNVLYSSDIIRKEPGRCDINEVSFLSSKASLIIGRASGPFTFAVTQQNLFEREPSWLCFCRQDFGNPFWLGNRFSLHVKYTSEIPQFRATSRKEVCEIVASTLENLG